MAQKEKCMSELIYDYIHEVVKSKKGEEADPEGKLDELKEHIDNIAGLMADGEIKDVTVVCEEKQYDSNGEPMGSFVGIPKPEEWDYTVDNRSVMVRWEDGTYTEAVMDDSDRTIKSAGFALALFKKVFGKCYDEVMDSTIESMSIWKEIGEDE